RGTVIHVVAPGHEAAPGWAEAALARFDETDVVAVAPIVVDRQRPERILSAGLRYARSGSISWLSAGRTRERFAPDDMTLCGPDLACGFYRREALTAVASLPDEGNDAAASIELALALQNGGRCVQEPNSVLTADRNHMAAIAWHE